MIRGSAIIGWAFALIQLFAWPLAFVFAGDVSAATARELLRAATYVLTELALGVLVVPLAAALAVACWLCWLAVRGYYRAHPELLREDWRKRYFAKRAEAARYEMRSRRAETRARELEAQILALGEPIARFMDVHDEAVADIAETVHRARGQARDALQQASRILFNAVPRQKVEAYLEPGGDDG